MYTAYNQYGKAMDKSNSIAHLFNVMIASGFKFFYIRNDNTGEIVMNEMRGKHIPLIHCEAIKA